MSEPRTLPEELTGAEALTGSKAGRLSPDAEAEIERARITNVITAAIAGLSWGENMSTQMRRAYAEYCRRYDVDPVTEMDQLGGQPYVNSEWYKRKLGELRIAGIVSDVRLQHIHADPRLGALMTDERLTEDQRAQARTQWFESQMLRIAHNVPEEAAAACVCTITLASGGSPIKAAKWGGNGTSIKQPRRNGIAEPNPVAEANAPLYVESTAMRRAASMLFSHLTGQRLSDKADDYIGLARMVTADTTRTLPELPNPAAMVAEGKRLAPAWTGKPKPEAERHEAPTSPVTGPVSTVEPRTDAERDASMRSTRTVLTMAARARDPYDAPPPTEPPF